MSLKKKLSDMQMGVGRGDGGAICMDVSMTDCLEESILRVVF